MARSIPPVAPPKTLKQLQRLAAAAIRQPLGTDYQTRDRWYDGRRATADVAAVFIKPNDRLTSFERLAIYNRQYWYRLLDILYDDYPGLRAILGEKSFNAMCRAYLELYPSRSFTLRNLGSKLERFLTDQPRWAGRRLAMALDMTRFEWAQVVAFDGPVSPVISPETVAKTHPAKLKLSLQPYLTLLEMSYPLDDFILAVKRQNAALRSEASNAIETRTRRKKTKPIRLPRARQTFLAVHRFDNVLYYKRLDPIAFQILSNLQAGQALEKACGSAVKQSKKPIAPAQIGQWFQNWSELGWLCKR